MRMHFTLIQSFKGVCCCALFLVISLFVISCDTNPPKDYKIALDNCNIIDTIIGEQIIFPKVKCVEGYSLPNFSSLTLSGDSITTEKIIGRTSVINFWFIGCPPCEAEIPGFNTIVEKYEKQGVQFIAIGRNKPNDIKDFLMEKPWDFNHVSDPDEKIINDIFGMRWGFPTTFIVDKNGIIQKAFSGGSTDLTATEMIIQKVEPVLDRLLK